MSPTAAPAVSVVVPTRERWDVLGRTLGGVLRQDGVEVEVLVVYDGPAAPRGSVPELDDPRVRLVRSPAPRGVAHARNQGLEEAGAPLVAFLDDDDLWAPTKLRAQAAALDPDGSFAYGSCLVVDERLRPLVFEAAPALEDLRSGLCTHCAVPACGSMILTHTDLARELGGFDPGFHHFSDWDIAVRLLERAPAAACHDILVGYVRHAGSMSSAALAGLEEDIALMERKHAAFGVQIDRHLLSRWAASGHRIEGEPAAAARTYLRAAVRHRSPGDIVRAGAVLLGERAMARGRRQRRAPLPDPLPGWLADYR